MGMYSLSKRCACLVLVCIFMVIFTVTVAFGHGSGPGSILRNPRYNGIWQTYGNGWKYVYYTKGDYALWKDGSAFRLRYDYSAKQWWDYGTSWNKIGAAGVSSTFIGDGSYHNLGKGWSYYYNSAKDYAYWKDGSALRFMYQYGKGTYGTNQWWDYGTAWNKIGASASSKFIGDGAAYYNLGNGWSYYYNAASDTSQWKYGQNLRFKYGYLAGQWWNQGNYGGWATLGSKGLSSSFMADEHWHDLYFAEDFDNLNNKWSYCYSAASDTSYWKRGTSWEPTVCLFKYAYLTGQWWNSSGGDLGERGPKQRWGTLGPQGLSSSFMGDGASHRLDSNWTYRYDYEKLYSSNGKGTWSDGSVSFIYEYLRYNWNGSFKSGSTYSTFPVGRFWSGYVFGFIGDGSWHKLDSFGWEDMYPSWNFRYDLTGGHLGYWKNSLGLTEYKYDYDAGLWYRKKGDGWITWGGAYSGAEFRWWAD